MKLKNPKPVKHTEPDDAPSVPETVPEQVNQNVTCSYGIHRGKFPVAGMQVKAARTVLKKLMKVDNAAVAVINGQVVSEDTVIESEATLLSFVKPSAVKGASEAIAVDGQTVKLNGQSLKVEQFCGLVAQHTISGMHAEPIPDNVKWVVKAGPLEVYIVELKPELRMIQWTDGGSGYAKRKLAAPYVVLAVAFHAGQLCRSMELFYRNRPLTSLNDPLYHSNLLNVSTSSGVAGRLGFTNWVCTQYLNLRGVNGQADTLSEIISHIFGGGFNRSSDRNEGGSGFSLYEGKKGADPRVKDVEKWEQASEQDPRFVLEVDWIDAKATPLDLIQFRMKQFSVSPAPTTSKALGNLLLASKLLA